jgi:hypothetical protein
MKTLLLVNTGNDGDIIKESLIHNEKFFNKIIVLDRESLDNTISEIKSLNNPKISIIKTDAYLIHMQPLLNKLTLLNIVKDYDYYMILDADEFIVADSLEELNNIPKDQVGIISWRCYIPDNDVYNNFKENITTRRTIEPIGCHKVIIPSKTNVLLTLGNHYVNDSIGARITSIMLKTITLAHFPVRSREQINRKIDFFNKESLINLNSEQAIHLISNPRIETIEQLREKAINYISNMPGQKLIYEPVL